MAGGKKVSKLIFELCLHSFMSHGTKTQSTILLKTRYLRSQDYDAADKNEKVKQSKYIHPVVLSRLLARLTVGRPGSSRCRKNTVILDGYAKGRSILEQGYIYFGSTVYHFFFCRVASFKNSL